VNSIAQIKGCNYFTVMSSPEFKKLMEQDFDYVVTPACFDLDVAIVQDGTSAVQVQRYPSAETFTHLEKEKCLIVVLMVLQGVWLARARDSHRRPGTRPTTSDDGEDRTDVVGRGVVRTCSCCTWRAVFLRP
jgi:hypothetical protein